MWWTVFGIVFLGWRIPLSSYPYESIEPDDAKALMERLGFIEEYSFVRVKS
jgi:hypothetical protein